MINIKELINKIIWDRNQDKKDYTLFYYDRISKELKPIKFSQIKGLNHNFIILNDTREIPMHRIKKVIKNEKVIWERY